MTTNLLREGTCPPGTRLLVTSNLLVGGTHLPRRNEKAQVFMGLLMGNGGVKGVLYSLRSSVTAT
jgi:hypothetical protein